jgi:predicted ATP-grasp superfamily ATP-dependent carboligase
VTRVVRAANPAEVAGWDALVRRFANHRVAHTRAWVESLAATGYGEPLYLVFEQAGEILGCLPGLTSTVLGLRVFGSPREGWQTVSMGPAFDPERIDTATLLELLVPYLEREHGIAHIELMSPELDAAAMRTMGFAGRVAPTYRLALTPHDEPAALKAMKDSARRNIKRAERLGIEIRYETDERFVDTHYQQLRQVYERGGFSISFSKRRVLECFRHLQADGKLIAAAAYLPGGEICIATGMFFVEGRELQLWMWATDPHYRWYRPTELMTWSVMRRAMELGCDTMDFNGRGEFKSVFGAAPDASKQRWLRSRPAWIAAARTAAGAVYRVQQSARGRAKSLVRAARSAASARPAAAVVLGDVDLVRSLGLAGIESVVVAPKGNAARFSRSTRGALDWVDPWDRPDDMVETLIRHAQQQAEPPVLFFQEDRSLLLVSRNREKLRQSFRFVIADAPLVEALVDKARFQQLAAKLRLPVPPARAVDTAASDVPSGLMYPLIVKPITRRNSTWQPVVGDGKALRVTSDAELRALWPKMAQARASVLLQSLIEGPESRIESYHTYVDERGEIVAEFTGKKIRTWPVEYGDTSALEITDAADVRELGREVVKKLKLKGVAKLDFKRAENGWLYLLEVNPRFTLWHHPAARAGCNIPALVYGDLLGRPRPAIRPARAGVRWVRAWTDHAAARAGGMTWAQWLPWMFGCQAKSAFALSDPLPLVGAGLYRRLGRRAQQAPAPETPHLIPNPVAPR